MFSRAVLSAVSLAALILVLVSCGGGQSTPVRTSPPTPTATTLPSLSSAPTPLPVPGPTSSLGSAPVLTPTPTSAPAPAPASAPTPTLSALPAAASTAAPTAAPVLTPTPAPAPAFMPAAALAPTSTPAAFPTPTPVSTQTSTSVPGASYLAEEIPPCTPVTGSSVDPCEQGAEGALIASSGGLIIFDVPLGVKSIFNGAPTTPAYTTHVVLRGTYIPGTVRCTSGHPRRLAAYVASFYVGNQAAGFFIYCFVDVRVNAYLLGSGPPTLTVIVERSLYAQGGAMTTTMDWTSSRAGGSPTSTRCLRAVGSNTMAHWVAGTCRQTGLW